VGKLNYYIHSVEYYLPEKIITNKYLTEECGIDGDFLANKVGISERHIAGEGEPTSMLAASAAQKLFDATGAAKEETGLILLCTQHPDYRLPTTACIVQDKLKLPTTCMAFDVNLGCSGFVYSLSIAGNFIRTGMVKQALIIMADEYSSSINYRDKNTASLFGDAGAAALLKPCEEGAGVIDCDFGTDGSGSMNLCVKNSGVARDPSDPGNLYMNGREIFRFSVTTVPASVRKVLERNGLSVGDIRYFVFHQANQYMLGELKGLLGISDEQMYIDMQETGNTVSASIPVAYRRLLAKTSLREGDWIVFCGFGVGLSWGTVLYKYHS
jgi:3-oxoacyl-[acyl-carrier-protein] synthase-3